MEWTEFWQCTERALTDGEVAARRLLEALKNQLGLPIDSDMLHDLHMTTDDAETDAVQLRIRSVAVKEAGAWADHMLAEYRRRFTPDADHTVPGDPDPKRVR